MTTQPFIFIVDDDQDDLEILSTTLEAEGIKVKTFGGGCPLTFPRHIYLGPLMTWCVICF